MPVDCEMMSFSAASQSMFDRSSFVDYHFASSFSTPPPQRRTFSVRSLPSPLRSCLITRDCDPSCVSPTEEPTSPSKMKKRVVFADIKGYPLTHVKIMTEPSDCPPRLKHSLFEPLTRVPSQLVPTNKWDLMFVQPASDYLEFRMKLETLNICLENVIVREADNNINGTIKVKNICYNKEVLLRMTFDKWKTHTDTQCKYVPSCSEGTSIHDMYDTFFFELLITPEAVQSKRIEFCVCFKTDNGEFWDSNGGSNYVITSSSQKQAENEIERFEDALKASFSSWTEFASWNHLVNDTPYW